MVWHDMLSTSPFPFYTGSTRPSSFVCSPTLGLVFTLNTLRNHLALQFFFSSSISLRAVRSNIYSSMHWFIAVCCCLSIRQLSSFSSPSIFPFSQNYPPRCAYGDGYTLTFFCSLFHYLSSLCVPFTHHKFRSRRFSA